MALRKSGRQIGNFHLGYFFIYLMITVIFKKKISTILIDKKNINELENS